MDLPACVKISGNRFLRRKDTQKSYLFCYLPHLSTEKESLRFKGSVINTGSLFSAPDDKKQSKTQWTLQIMSASSSRVCFLNTFQSGKNTE